MQGKMQDNKEQNTTEIAQSYLSYVDECVNQQRKKPGTASNKLVQKVAGLVSEADASEELKRIIGLETDDYIDHVVTPSELKKRLASPRLIKLISESISNEVSQGPLYSAEAVISYQGRSRQVAFIAQDRNNENGAWMPEHHQAALKLAQAYAKRHLPIVCLIDTPGANAGAKANAENQAHSISALIAEMAQITVPTVGVVVGAGYSGGAIPFAATNMLFSVRDGLFNTIQPPGLAAIAKRFNLSWQQCAKTIGISAYELLEQDIFDGVIDYSPLQEDGVERMSATVFTAIDAIEQDAKAHALVSEKLSVFYDERLKRFAQNGNGDFSPTEFASLFGFVYAHQRTLTLRKRLGFIDPKSEARQSTVVPLEGDLQQRERQLRESRFTDWLEKPQLVRYEEGVNRYWEKFLAAREDKDSDRGAVASFFLGKPAKNYEIAKIDLAASVLLHLYNHWKADTSHNLNKFGEYLQNNKALTADELVRRSSITFVDLLLLDEIKDLVAEFSRFLVLFYSLYEHVESNLVVIAREAQFSKELSFDGFEKVFTGGLEFACETNSIQMSADSFLKCLISVSEQGFLNDFLKQIEQWKRGHNPRLSEVLFVIISHFFERLLPDYYAALHGESTFVGKLRPSFIGRRKDFWNRLAQAYRDLQLSDLLEEVKLASRKSVWLAEGSLKNFSELNGDLFCQDKQQFPGYKESIKAAKDKGVTACGVITGLAEFEFSGLNKQVGVIASNLRFQAGAFDTAAAEKACALFLHCAEHKLPVICLISSGGMQTKEGANALFSMPVVNQAISQFREFTGLPVIMFGYGDCTGGAQASFVTHPEARTYYLSCTNMPFAGQRVVPDYLPVPHTLSNYLTRKQDSMTALVKNPFVADLDKKLRAVDPDIPLPSQTIDEVLARELLCIEVDDSEAETASVSNITKRYEPFTNVMVHARGCTAVRLVTKAKAAGLSVILPQSDPDMGSVAASLLGENDHLVSLGGSTSDESYLNADSVIAVALQEDVQALHPGIGFLAENADFANKCVEKGLNFVGPEGASMSLMGDKARAITTAQEFGVPVVPGSGGTVSSAAVAKELAPGIGYPMMIKAAHGGGGKGIEVVYADHELADTFIRLSAEARAAFGNGDLYLEKFITRIKHIEVQVLRDSHGNCKLLGLRDCSVQRNKQKLVEESDSVDLPQRLREQAYEYSRQLSDGINYVGAGTVEFIYDLDAQEIYFMEMNTRLQVEHPVTEATAEIDIVGNQFRIAAGESIADLDVANNGFAIEVRVTAESAKLVNDKLRFTPAPGKVESVVYPEDDAIEIISCIADNTEVTPYYDSLVAQIIATAPTRDETIDKMIEYLSRVEIKGLPTNIPLLLLILDHEDFRTSNHNTQFLDPLLENLDQEEKDKLLAASDVQSAVPDVLSRVRVAGSNELKVFAPSASVFYRSPSPSESVFVNEGDIVTWDQTICLMESMKLFSNFNLKSAAGGTEVYKEGVKYEIKHIPTSDGQQVNPGDLLFVICPVEAA